MARYIDVDKMHEFNCPEIWKSGEGCPDEGCAECFYSNGGAEDVAPVVHAKWLPWEELYECSNCGFALRDNSAKYCQNCGARMEDKE